MVDKVKKRLKKIDKKYPAISHQCYRYIENNSKIDENNNINIFHRPWVAPQNWGIKLFDSVKSKWIKDFKTRTEKSIPDFYKDFLKISNGGFIYDLSLYGLPPSIYTKGVLSRSVLQCHDLTSANNSWIVEYDIDKDSFYFGGRAYTFDENVGYFYKKNEILCARKNGEIIAKWNDFNDFINDEVKEAEKMMQDKTPENTEIIISNEF